VTGPDVAVAGFVGATFLGVAGWAIWSAGQGDDGQRSPDEAYEWQRRLREECRPPRRHQGVRTVRPALSVREQRTAGREFRKLARQNPDLVEVNQLASLYEDGQP
jgi:hypothetical protein